MARVGRRRRGRIVGQAWLHVLDKLPNPVGEKACHAYFSNLYVTPSARGGVGAACCPPRSMPTRPTKSTASFGRRCEVGLYLRHGFNPNGDVLEKALDALRPREEH
jgi:hypothetical protein